MKRKSIIILIISVVVLASVVGACVFEMNLRRQGTVLCLDKMMYFCYNCVGDRKCQDKQEERAKPEFTT